MNSFVKIIDAGPLLILADYMRDKLNRFATKQLTLALSFFDTIRVNLLVMGPHCVVDRLRTKRLNAEFFQRLKQIGSHSLSTTNKTRSEATPERPPE